MAYSKIGNDNYRKKCKTIGLKYTPNERNEYDRIIKYCKDINKSYQGYIKELVKSDLDNKGIEYPNDVE